MQVEFNNNSTVTYIYLDGDNIGDRIEHFLEEGNLTAATEFSNSIHQAMKDISYEINKTKGASLYFAGGDDIVLSLEAEDWDIKIIKRLQEVFQKYTGCTMSGGIGFSIQEALHNLGRAKYSGKNILITQEETMAPLQKGSQRNSRMKSTKLSKGVR